MADGNQDHHWQTTERNRLDRELNAALAKYVSVEPRAGMEERILANLRAEREHPPDLSWWRWSAAVAFAAGILIAAMVTLRSSQLHAPVIANQPPTTVSAREQSGPPVAPRQVGSNTHPQAAPRTHRLMRTARPAAFGAACAGPKLDQFPSPQPLSEQEKIMASYVAEYPEQAALLAQARMEALRRDVEERRVVAGDSDSRQ